MFQQHQGESLSEAWTRFKDLLEKVPHHGIDLWLPVQIFYDHVNPTTRRTIDQLASGDSMARVNAVSIDYLEKDAPRRKEIKSPSKLLSPKYQSQSSLEEQNRNTSSPKRVHFINSIVLLRKEDKPEEEEIMEPNAAKGDDHSMTVGTE
ncbi:hypothetical protein Tco_0513999 [Tanacetum coccineum]